jgi:hypothetical protein
LHGSRFRGLQASFDATSPDQKAVWALVAEGQGFLLTGLMPGRFEMEHADAELRAAIIIAGLKLNFGRRSNPVPILQRE